MNSFERWYYYDNHYQHHDRNIFKPLTTHLAKQKNFIGGWKIPIKKFREELNKYIKETLDLLCEEWDTKTIAQYLNDLLGTDGQILLTQRIGNHMCYIIKPEKTIELLKTFNYYIIKKNIRPMVRTMLRKYLNGKRKN